MAHLNLASRRRLEATNLALLISVLISLLAVPLLESVYSGRALLLGGLTLVFVAGTFAASSRFRLIAVTLLVIGVPVAWSTLFVESTPLFVLHCLVGGAFFLLIAGLVLNSAMRTFDESFDCVFAAICSYLLTGMAFAMIYWALHAASADNFSFPANLITKADSTSSSISDFSLFVYFSFVTMSTLGFGDITPVGRITRTVCWMQSITGQFYVAVVVAWLVSAIPAPGRSNKV